MGVLCWLLIPCGWVGTAESPGLCQDKLNVLFQWFWSLSLRLDTGRCCRRWGGQGLLPLLLVCVSPVCRMQQIQIGVNQCLEQREQA